MIINNNPGAAMAARVWASPQGFTKITQAVFWLCNSFRR